MVAFATIKPGDVLYDVHRTKMGNTTRSRLGCWPVKVVEIDIEKRSAMCSWNGNPPTRYYERQLDRLRRSRPARAT